MAWMWLLGAGASADFLPTFAGRNFKSDFEFKQASLALARAIMRRGVPETTPLYKCIQVVSPPDSFILTQNIDGVAKSTGMPVVELHLRRAQVVDRVPGGGDTPAIERIVHRGEALDPKVVTEARRLIKHRRPVRVIVLGTSLAFPYLRTLINVTKSRGAKVIHINPDPDYNCWEEQERMGYGRIKQVPRVRKNERWICAEGIPGITEMLEDDESDEE